MAHAVQWWDVFTDAAFGGNPLAVVLDADDLDGAAMQALAREFGLSETAFVVHSSVADVRARYFTPATELPMAGHPTIGTAFALDAAGRLSGERARFELGVGPRELTLERDDGRLRRVWMDQGTPHEVGRVEDRAAVARALGLEPRALVASLPLSVVTAGVPFLLVPVIDRGELARVRLDLSAIAPFVPPEHRAVLAFTLDSDDSHVSARMFGEALGVVEDPATGSAHGPLGAYLAWHGRVPVGGRFLSRQGVAMGRPSEVWVRTRGDGGAVAVEVGGGAVPVLRGALAW